MLRAGGGDGDRGVLTEPRLQALPFRLRHVAGAARGPAPAAREPNERGGGGGSGPRTAPLIVPGPAPRAAGRWRRPARRG